MLGRQPPERVSGSTSFDVMMTTPTPRCSLGWCLSRQTPALTLRCGHAFCPTCVSGLELTPDTPCLVCTL